MCGCLLHASSWGPGQQPRMCPDWELNQRPLGSQADTQSTEPHQPGHGPFSICDSYLSVHQLQEPDLPQGHVVTGGRRRHQPRDSGSEKERGEAGTRYRMY